MALKAICDLVDRYPDNDAIMQEVHKTHEHRREQMKNELEAALRTRYRLMHRAVGTVACHILAS